MTAVAIDALEREVNHAHDLFATITPAEWHEPSGCAGWRVQDVVQHMAAVFQQIADPASIDVGDSGKAEEANDVVVEARRDWTVDQVLDAYREWSLKGVAALAALQEPPMSETVVPIADLGTHPLHLLCNAIVFDHYCHLRHDIGESVPRAKDLPREEGTLQATLEWMLAGLPQMCAEALAAAPQQAVNLVFDGPAGGSYVLTPAEGGWTVMRGTDPGAPTVHTTVHDFVSWGTKRSDWRDATTGDVDDEALAAVLDAVNII